MQRQENVSNAKPSTKGRFVVVLDSRKRKIRGLWTRNGSYYAQLNVAGADGRRKPRRVRLTADTLDEAKAALEKVRTQNGAGALPTAGLRPKFDDLAREYLAGPILAQKKLGTQENERYAIHRWSEHLGGVRVDKITKPMIHAYREKRLGQGRSSRTVNLDHVVFRNVLRLAVERGHIERLPEVRQLKQKPSPRRALLSKAEFQRLLDATAVSKNGPTLAFYLRFLALSGAREQEALAVRWADVDFDREMVTIGSGGIAKNHRERTVDFSAELKALLLEMRDARAPDTSWLFPSPQRGPKDERAKSLRESLRLTRTAAGLPRVGFHDLRHFFASQCVMAGIDFMTIAAWLGHSDGGILVGKVYGHLADSHKKTAAEKLRFFDV